MKKTQQRAVYKGSGYVGRPDKIYFQLFYILPRVYKKSIGIVEGIDISV